MKVPPTVLVALPRAWDSVWDTALGDGRIRLIRLGAPFDPAEIDYVLSFRPPPGLLASLPNLKAVFSMGAGVDGFLGADDYPAHIPLFRFCDPTLTIEMAQYVVLYALMHHRGAARMCTDQAVARWHQVLLPRRTEDTRVGILGLGEIGAFVAQTFVRLGFTVNGWSRSAKTLPGVRSFAGTEALSAFFAATDLAVCLLPLTAQTAGILNAAAFAAMPADGFVINVARGGHLVAGDLIAALDTGHLSGAVLDVFDVEPLPADSPLWRHPKIVVTPHIAAITQPAVAAGYVLAGIEALERGETPLGRVDLNRGY